MPPLPQAEAGAGGAALVPPPVPVRVLPVSEFNPPAAGGAGSAVVGVVALTLAVIYLAGMLWLIPALPRSGGGAPTTTDFVLFCAVFPLSLVTGAGLLCLSVIGVMCAKGWGRTLAALAAVLNAAAFFLVFTGK